MEKDVISGYTSLGEYLVAKRKEKSLSVQDVVKFTRIRVQYINALENNSYEELPERTYALGYLRSYASYLQLSNVQELVDYLDSQYHFENTPSKDDYNNKNNEDGNLQKRIRTSQEAEKVFLDKGKSGNDLLKKNNPKLLFTVAIVIAGLFIVAVYFFHASTKEEKMLPYDKNGSANAEEEGFLVVNKSLIQPDSDDTTNNLTPVPYIAQESIEPVKPLTIGKKDGVNTEVIEDNKPIAETFVMISRYPKETKNREVTIEFSDDVWVKIYNSNDHKEVFLIRTFRAGQNYTVPGVENLSIDIGNYKGVQFKVGSKIYVFPERSDRSLVVNNVDLSKDNISSLEVK